MIQPNSTSTPTFSFSPSQQVVSDYLDKWVFSRSKKPLIITGAAGTGKSTLLKHFLYRYLTKLTPVVTAPTNPATRVLQNFFGESEALPVMTTQKAFTMVMTTQSEEKKLVQKNTQAMFDYDMLVVDECSIVNTSLFNTIQGFDGFKLFSGHKSQLPAVEDNGVEREMGIVFEQDDYILLKLTEAHRNAGALATYCQKLEDAIYEPKLIPSPYMRWARELPAILETQAEGLQSGDTQLLAYTNARVEELNAAVRLTLFGANSEWIQAGDRMMTPDYTHLFTAGVSKKGNTLEGVYRRAGAVTLSANTRFVVHGVEVVMVLGVKAAELTISVEEEGEGKPRGFIYLPIDLVALEQLKAEYRTWARSVKTLKARHRAWEIFHKIDMLFPLARHCYATTVHSSQGRTIKSVIADFTNIETCQNEVIRKKLLYVAASRASKELVTLR